MSGLCYTRARVGSCYCVDRFYLLKVLAHENTKWTVCFTKNLASKQMNQKSTLTIVVALSLWSATASVYAVGGRARWRTASEAELRKIIPARAAVVSENIETEFRTASGVTD